VITNDVSDSYQ